MAILPPPRRRDHAIESAPEGVFDVAVESSVEVAAPRMPAVDEAVVRARLDEIRWEAQQAALLRSSNGSASSCAHPMALVAPVLPETASAGEQRMQPSPSVASVGVDPSLRPVPPLADVESRSSPLTPAGIAGKSVAADVPASSNGHVAPPVLGSARDLNGHVNGNGHHHSDVPTFEGPMPIDPTVEIDLRSKTGASSAPSDQPGTLLATNVSAWFGKRKVLERSSLDMRAGLVTALIGPSGCGKSTFLRILNRMHEVVPGAQMGGLVALDGVDIYSDRMNSTEVRLRIGMVFQKPNPFPAMSIRENVLAGLKLTGTKTADPNALVEASLRRAGLWNEVKDRLDQGGAALSGGQQQRLCIARALAVKPSVLLMDEPCSALDPISTRVIEETIKALAHEITIVIVTHNMQQAQRVSDECAFFLVEEQGKPGRLIESGPTAELFTNPRDQRTGDYVSGRFG